MFSAPRFSRATSRSPWLRPSCTLLFVLLLAPMLARATSAQATLDRSTAQLGETVTLNLRVDGGGSASQSDIAPLAQDFTILNSSGHPSVSIVNGVPHVELIIGVALQPKRTGTLTIPSLTIAGSRTEPLQLEVTAPDPHASADSGENVFMEATVDAAHAYVGQQMLFTVRLYFTGNLNSGSLEDPLLPGVDLRRLTDDLDYQTQRGNRTYNVLERRYALIPQQAGHIQIPPVSFRGVAIDPNDINSFIDGGTSVTVQSRALSIDVQAAPAHDDHARWLPARKLELSLDGAPAHTELRVGQPLNLTMNLRATGLPYETLPDLSLPTIDGATVYPDKPVTRTRSDGQWLLGERQQSFAIVPERAGTLVIPETTLHWFNVLTGKPEIARIPAQQFSVLAVPGTVAATVSPAVSATSASTSPAASTTVTGADGTPWRWIALGSLALWLLSLVAWLLWRRPRAGTVATTPSALPSIREARQAFLRAATGSDAAQQAQRLLAWARAERPALQNLGELSEQLAAEAQRMAIAALQRRLYAPTRATGSDPDLVAAFKSGFAWRERGVAADGNDPLPPLYPFKLDR